MNKEFASNAILIIVINLLVKAFYLFGIDRTVQNILPEGEYGLYFTLFTFAYLWQIISDFGLQNYNYKNLSQHPQLLTKYFPHLITLRFLLGLVFLCFLLIAGWLWGFDQKYLPFLLLIGCNQILQTLVLFLRSNLGGLGLYRIDSLASVLDKSLLIIICGILIWHPVFSANFELLWFVLAHTLAYTITIVLLLFYLRPHLNGLQLRVHFPTIVAFVKASAPYALVIFLMTAYTRIDVIMIEKMLANGLVEADRYASGYRLLDAGNVAGFLLAGLLLPMFAKMLKQKEQIAPLVRLSLSTIWTGAITVATAVWWFATPLMETLYVDGNAYSGEIVRWLMLTFVAMTGSYIYGTLLTANGSLRRMNQLFAVSILLNLILNLWWIPKEGAVGAAKATFITQSLVFVAQLILAIRLLDIEVKPRFFMSIILFAGFTGVCSWILSTYPIHHHWSVNFLLAISFGIIFSFLIRLLNIREWLSWLRPSK